jgi:hypothetical protein
MSNYDEPPYRRTVWYLHRQQGELILEEYVLAADERTGEFSKVVRHEVTPVAKLDYPSPAKFEAVAANLPEGESMELSPADEYWDEDELDDGDDAVIVLDELEIAALAADVTAEVVIPALARALVQAARALESEGIDPEIAARFVFEALGRYLQQDSELTHNEMVDLENLDAENARRWFADNPPDA